jgi:hypothetical protein
VPHLHTGKGENTGWEASRRGLASRHGRERGWKDRCDSNKGGRARVNAKCLSCSQGEQQGGTRAQLKGGEAVPDVRAQSVTDHTQHLGPNGSGRGGCASAERAHTQNVRSVRGRRCVVLRAGARRGGCGGQTWRIKVPAPGMRGR